MSPVHLSVVTVSWNSAGFLPRCIESVAESAGGMSFEHFVVDNASSDGSADLVAKRYPGVKLMRNRDNLGFARANNLAAREARGRFVLFLNPDTEVLGTALETMISLLEAHPDIGILGPKLLGSDGRWSRDMGFRPPTLRTVFNEFLGLSQLLPFPRLFPGIMRSRDFEGLEECGWVSGAALLVRGEVVERELWDEGIFFLGEDIEYCDRVRAQGLRICATGDASVVHHSGQSMSKQTVEFLAGHSSGIATYLRRTQGPAAAWLGLKVVRLGYYLRSVLHRAVYRLSGNSTSLRKAQRLQQYLKLDAGE